MSSCIIIDPRYPLPLKVPLGWDTCGGQNFGAMEEQLVLEPTVKDSSNRFTNQTYTQRTLGVMPGKDGRLYAIGSATNGIARYIQATVEELQADPNWRDKLMQVENREGGIFFKLASGGLLNL